MLAPVSLQFLSRDECRASDLCWQEVPCKQRPLGSIGESSCNTVNCGSEQGTTCLLV